VGHTHKIKHPVLDANDCYLHLQWKKIAPSLCTLFPKQFIKVQKGKVSIGRPTDFAIKKLDPKQKNAYTLFKLLSFY